MRLVGIGKERVHVDTNVGRPVPNWNDWKADAVRQKNPLAVSYNP